LALAVGGLTGAQCGKIARITLRFPPLLKTHTNRIEIVTIEAVPAGSPESMQRFPPMAWEAQFYNPA
jgi:hypothetical protein